MGGLRHPQHSQTGSSSSTIAADSSNGVTNTRCCRYSLCPLDDGWKYHPKHVEQFPDINKLCNVASCWIYEYTGILLGAHPILHISRIRVTPLRAGTRKNVFGNWTTPIHCLDGKIFFRSTMNECWPAYRVSVIECTSFDIRVRLSHLQHYAILH